MKKAPGEVTVSLQFARHLGPRYAQAAVTLTFSPAPEYSFESAVTWPDVDCTSFVKAGVEAAFTEMTGGLPHTRVVLTAMEWHTVDSSQKAFEQAAYGATVASLTV